VNQQLAQNKPIDQKQFEADMARWEWTWVNGHEAYTDQPKGSEIAVAKQLYQKYQTEIKNSYN